LRGALEMRPDHIVISGDLTEDGTACQFEVLAEVLADAGVAPERVTLVPGNHDAYHAPSGFSDALAGPLRPYAPTSVPGVVVLLRNAAVVAVSTAFHQSAIRSAGKLDGAQVGALRALLKWPEMRDRAVVLAMHHPPVPHSIPGGLWVDGLVDYEGIADLMRSERRLHALCGHTHHRADHALSEAGTQVYIASAVADDDDPLRAYAACAGQLEAIDLGMRRELVPALA
jgi:3',5'-cyclic AMP phosphodiesterase CpdA